MRFDPEGLGDRVAEELARRHGLDATWSVRVDVDGAGGDGGFRFTAEVTREYDAGGEWRWFHGSATAEGAWSIEALEPHSFGPEGADVNVVRARRRAIGRPVLDEARVGVVEAELRRRVPGLPRWPITRVSRERVEGNETVFEFASLAWEGGEPRVAVWYVGRARASLETCVAAVEVREHPASRSLVRTRRTPATALEAAVEATWLELGFPPNERFMTEREKRERLIDALRHAHPPAPAPAPAPAHAPTPTHPHALDGVRSRLGHVNLRGEPDRRGSFHFAAQVWEAGDRGGRVHSYRGIVALRGASSALASIEALEPLVHGDDGIDGVALRRRRRELLVPLFGPGERRSMTEALLRAAPDARGERPLAVEIRTTEESTLGGATRFAFAARRADGVVTTGEVSYDLETNTFDGAIHDEDAAGAPSLAALGFFQPDAADEPAAPRDTNPPALAPPDSALLEAILARPGDDGPRLVLARRLERRGDPRGELVRLQCAQERSGNTQALQRRVHELLRAHEAAWASAAGVRGASTIFSRGWPSTLIGSSAQILASRAALRTQPIEKLCVTSAVEGWAELMACAELARVRSLEVSPALGEYGRTSPVARAVVEALAQSRNLGGLRELSFRPAALDRAGAQVLARAPWLGALEAFSVCDAALDAATIAELVARLAAVRRLALAGCRLGWEGAEAIARSPTRRLEVLRLADAGVDARGVAALAASPALGSVTRLELERNGAGDEGAIALARSPHAGRLRELVLGRNGVGPEGAAALGASTSLASLESLDLRENHLGRAGVDALARATGLPALRRLAITRNEVYTGESVAFEAGSEAAGDYMVGTHQVEDTREQLAARFVGRPGLVIT